MPNHLVPRRLLASLARQSERQVFLNPDCCFSDKSSVQEFDPSTLPEAFAKEMTIAWVRDPERGTTLPFWLGQRLTALVDGLQADSATPDDLPEDVRSVLLAAGILIEEGHREKRQQEWEEIVRHCAERFREKGYVAFGGLVHAYQLAALRRYYRHLIRSGKMHLGDEHNPRRYVAHNEAVASFFHHQFASVVGSFVGERVKPSYVYVASYLEGEELKKHVDREQCEFSISMSLDFSPEPVCETSWPLQLDTPAGRLSVYQTLGDAFLYRGREFPHYRDPLPPGRSSTSIFFHYVRQDFQGSLD